MIGSEELPPFMQSSPSLVIVMIFFIVHAELGIGDYYDDKHLILDIILDTLKIHQLELKVWAWSYSYGLKKCNFSSRQATLDSSIFQISLEKVKLSSLAAGSHNTNLLLDRRTKDTSDDCQLIFDRNVIVFYFC